MSTLQDKAAIYDFTHLKLGKDDFDNLVFMNAPELDEWDSPWLVNLCVQLLSKVADDVIQQSNAEKAEGATQIFEKLYIRAYNSDSRSWFEKHARLSKCFDKRLMPALWIRNVGPLDGKSSGRENLSNKGCKWYIDDGNTRALVYAVRIACGEEKFESVKAIHATSWDFTKGILGHQPQIAEVLVREGKFLEDLDPSTAINQRIRWNRKTNEYCDCTGV